MQGRAVEEIIVSVEFLLTSLIVVASPGTGVLYTLSAGLSRGARASIIAAFGCTLGIIPHMAAAITGLAALLHTSAVATEGVAVGHPVAPADGRPVAGDKGLLEVEARAWRSPTTAGRMLAAPHDARHQAPARCFR